MSDCHRYPHLATGLDPVKDRLGVVHAVRAARLVFPRLRFYPQPDVLRIDEKNRPSRIRLDR